MGSGSHRYPSRTQKHGGFQVEKCNTISYKYKNGEGGVIGGHVGQIYHT